MPDNYLFNMIMGLLLFSLIIGVLIYIVKKTGGSKLAGMNKSVYMRSLDRLFMGNDKRLEIVEIGDTWYVLAITQNDIKVISRINKTIEKVGNDESKTNFQDMVERFIKKQGKTGG